MIIGPLIASPVIFAVGTVWPAYQTYKAVVENEASVMSRWLQYWFIFALVAQVSGMVDTVGEYFPFYWEAKVAFICWLTIDKFKGATYLFQQYITKALGEKTLAIDEQIDFLAARAKNFKVEDVRTFVNWASSTDVPALVASLSSAAAKKTATLTAGKASAAAMPEQSTEEKPQEPEEVAEVVEAEEEKKAK
jgi:hypothetical protein